jgi:tungstate transport system substrate-binding protein
MKTHFLNRYSRSTMLLARLVLVAILFAPILNTAKADSPYITVSSTTSTKNSALYDYLLPLFTEKTGIEVRVVAVGTGKAIRLAQAGDADVLLVHHKLSEEKFVAEGFGVGRFDVMYNDFVLIGPGQDPADIQGEADATTALKKISDGGQPFASRGDDSGTNKKEQELWAAAGVDVKSVSGTWYRETGSGMGATLNVAAAMNAYVLSDRSTWLKFGNKAGLKILVEGDKRLLNQYGVILVNKDRHPHIKVELGQTFIDWITGAEGQNYIAEYKIQGHQAFFPNANSGS